MFQKLRKRHYYLNLLLNGAKWFPEICKYLAKAFFVKTIGLKKKPLSNLTYKIVVKCFEVSYYVIK